MTGRQDDDEPDRVHRWSLSRRQALALGTGAMGGLAGCSELSGDLGGSSEQTTEEQRPSVEESIVTSAEYGIDEVSLELDLGGRDKSSVTESYWEQQDSFAGTLRLYAAPNLKLSDETIIAEQSIDQTESVATHTLEPDWTLGYAQQLRFTIEFTDSEQDGEHDLYAPDEMVVPFSNAARDKEMVRVMGPREPPKHWTAGGDEEASYKAQFWFDSPDDAFNTPNVPEGEYDSEWYPYRDITVTALVKYPSYENAVEREDRNDAGQLTGYYHVPLTDVVAFSFTIGQWEMLEGFRWNSRATQKLEAGQREHKNSSDAVDAIDDYQDLESIMEDESSKMAIDASSESDFYDEYYKSRFTETDYFQCKTNPLKVAAGRPVCYRIADSIGEAVDNPSFNTQEYVDYQKAIILQVFIGTNPYSFATSSYSLSPDEAINRWFLESQGEINGVGNCQDGTYLYCGVAAHLLDANVARIHVSANGILHVTAGAFDLRMPDSPFEIWADDHPAPTATRAHTKSTEYGELSLIECIYPDPTIGWKLNGSSEMKISTYLTNANIQSHIPLNDDYEPDQNGSVRTEADDPEIPWEFHENHNTISDVVDL